jgi:hypothetical protein
VRQHSDFLRARLRGAAVLFHWFCFIRAMRAREQRNAHGTEVMRCPRLLTNQRLQRRISRRSRNEGERMKKRKLITMLATVGPLLLWAGAALAANSGVGGIDTAFTSGGQLVTNTLGFGMGLVGVVGVGTGIRHGLMHQAEASFATLLGGAGIYNYPTIAPVLSLSGAALVHPATHAVIHAATKLVG